MNMSFFDRLEEHDICTSGGTIRGCYEETFDGITAGNKLQEMLLNPDSENSSVFSESDRNELIFRIFRTLAIGGGMCQPDTTTTRYLEMTQALYKDLLTVYRDSKTNEIVVAGKAFIMRQVQGLELFPHPDSPINQIILLVDPAKKQIVVFKVW